MTGVQTCALPISPCPPSLSSQLPRRLKAGWDAPAARPGQVLQRPPLPLRASTPDLVRRPASVVLPLPLSCPAPRLLRVQNSTGTSHHGPHGLPTSGSPHLGDPTSAPSRVLFPPPGMRYLRSRPLPTVHWPLAASHPGTDPVCPRARGLLCARPLCPPCPRAGLPVLRPALPRAGLRPAASLPLGPAARCARMRTPAPRPSLGSREQAAVSPVASATRAEAGPLSPASWQGLDSWHRACTCEDPLQERTDFHPPPQTLLPVGWGWEGGADRGSWPWPQGTRRKGQGQGPLGSQAHTQAPRPQGSSCRRSASLLCVPCCQDHTLGVLMAGFGALGPTGTL